MTAALPTRIPHGRTAHRLEWVHLPPHVRALVERRLGSPVVEATSQTSGFTPGFASVLVCADGTRHFVKAASTVAQRMFAEAYREEARKLDGLPESTPAPRLLWLHDADDWVVLGIEYVESRHPARPWSAADLVAVSDAVVAMAAALTPAPDVVDSTAVKEFSGWRDLWKGRPEPWAAECWELARRYDEVTAGDTAVHLDIRDDNLLLTADGRVLLCDWNWPIRGAAWLDSLFLLIGPRGDGLDVEAHIAAHPLLAQVDPESIDVVLALILGYFTVAGEQPLVPNSPHLRVAQAWQRDVVAAWLAERRGWS